MCGGWWEQQLSPRKALLKSWVHLHAWAGCMGHPCVSHYIKTAGWRIPRSGRSWQVCIAAHEGRSKYNRLLHRLGGRPFHTGGPCSVPGRPVSADVLQELCLTRTERRLELDLRLNNGSRCGRGMGAQLGAWYALGGKGASCQAPRLQPLTPKQLSTPSLCARCMPHPGACLSACCRKLVQQRLDAPVARRQPLPPNACRHHDAAEQAAKQGAGL